MPGKFFERPQGREHLAEHPEHLAERPEHRAERPEHHPLPEAHKEVQNEMHKQMLERKTRAQPTHLREPEKGHLHEDTAQKHLPSLTIENKGAKGIENHGVKGTEKKGEKGTPASDSGDATPSKTGFSQRLLEGIGAPVTPENLKFLDAWQRAEGGPKDNPFNTSQNERGATTFNKDGVKRYDSMDVGIQATIATLKAKNYQGIVAGLKAGNDAHKTALAVRDSTWGSKNITNFI